MHPARIISSEAVHYQLVKTALRAVYRANRCYHLDASVSFLPTFDALGKTLNELQNRPNTDIDQVNLMQEIGCYTEQFFQDRNSFPTIEHLKQSIGLSHIHSTRNIAYPQKNLTLIRPLSKSSN